MVTHLLLITSVGSAAACATGSPGARVDKPSTFPTREALSELTREPAPALAAADAYADVAEWALAGPFPGEAARTPVTGDEPWTADLRAAVAPRAGVTLATQSMQCTARELGRFVLQHGKIPAPALREFMTARCGAIAVELSTRWVTGTADAGKPDAQLYAEWRDRLRPMLDQLPAGNGDVGFAMVRAAEKVVVMVAAGRRRAHLEALGPDPSAPNTYVLRAELLEPAASVRVMINRGAFGFGECEVQFATPKLEARCTGNADDAGAWIAVASFPEGRVLGSEALDVLVWPKGTPVDAYVRPKSLTSRRAENAAALRQHLLAGINELRERASLPALVEEGTQSATAMQVAPYYFAAQLRQLPATVADVAALGLRAGWQVEALIERGQFAAPATFGSDDVGELLSLAIEKPFGRETLLDPRARRVALGAVHDGGAHFLGAVITTYALLEPPEADLEEKLWQRFASLRAGGGRPPFERDRRLDERAAGLQAALLDGSTTADGALDQLMAGFTRGASGYWIEFSDPSKLQLPEALLRAAKVRASTMVARHRRAGEPWGTYVVFLVTDGMIAEMNI